MRTILSFWGCTLCGWLNPEGSNSCQNCKLAR